MANKFLTVEALSTMRDGLKLDQKVDQAVNAFLSSDEGGELEDVKVDAKVTSGGFGEAFVHLKYKPHDKKKK